MQIWVFSHWMHYRIDECTQPACLAVVYQSTVHVQVLWISHAQPPTASTHIMQYYAGKAWRVDWCTKRRFSFHHAKTVSCGQDMQMKGVNALSNLWKHNGQFLWEKWSKDKIKNWWSKEEWRYHSYGAQWTPVCINNRQLQRERITTWGTPSALHSRQRPQTDHNSAMKSTRHEKNYVNMQKET